MATVLEKIGIAGIRPEAEEPSVNAGTAEGQELVQRLVRNARELRRQWRELDGISMPRARPPARGETIEQSEIPVGATPDGVICDDEFGDCEAEDVKVEPSGSRLLTRDIEAESVRGAIYSILSVAGQIDREELLRQAAQKLGFARISKKLRGRLNKTIGAEVRYGRIRMDSDGCCSCTQESSLCFRSAAGS